MSVECLAVRVELWCVVGAGVPGSIRAESRMVIETVSKSTTTSTMMTQQQQQQQQQQMFIQQQQQQQIQQLQAVPTTLPVDASKVTTSGTGLSQATVSQEMSFIVDGSQSGQFSRLSLVLNNNYTVA